MVVNFNERAIVSQGAERDANTSGINFASSAMGMNVTSQTRGTENNIFCESIV